MPKQSIHILMADDDRDDVLLTQKAIAESRLINTFASVQNGEELLRYLRNEGEYADKEAHPRPGIILLDLNMPRKDGRETLKEIKADPKLKDIPVIIFTTSKTEEDVYRSYLMGVNSFITKPVTFEKLIDVIKMIGRYWFEIVQLPERDGKIIDSESYE